MSLIPQSKLLLQNVRVGIAKLLIAAAASLDDPKDLSGHEDLVVRSVVRGRKAADFSFNAFTMMRVLKTDRKGMQTFVDGLYAGLTAALKEGSDIVSQVVQEGTYLHFVCKPTALTNIVELILKDGYLSALASETKSRPQVMVEYSQPNTHKAFHVGHMRNVALGDSLVRIHQLLGFPVQAVNYFGDEGAHVAKAMWLLCKEMDAGKFDLDKLPSDVNKGEWLGSFYSRSVELLDWSAVTKFPVPSAVAAKVLTKQSFAEYTGEGESCKAPANWNVVTVSTGGDGAEHLVVCGGTGYNVGDLVAYVPVGGTMGGKTIGQADKGGLMSNGVIMAWAEAGLKPPPSQTPKEEKTKGKKNKKKKKKGNKNKGSKQQIAVLSDDFVGEYKVDVGSVLCDAFKFTPESEPKMFAELKELGKQDLFLGADETVSQTMAQRQKEVRDMLLTLEKVGLPEHKEEESNSDEHSTELTKEELATQALWVKTRNWSLEEFRRIYKWLDATFHHDFFETEVSEPSLAMCKEKQWYEKEVLIHQNGAVVADLTKEKLGFCVLIKSNGSGLYATKDLALARRKFDQFHVEKSIYVVDMAQTLHFKQVFAVLKRMGFEHADKCIHLPYGLVTLPHGKMSSRKGTVILFSQLREQLREQIMNDFLVKYTKQYAEEHKDDEEKEKPSETWSDEEVATVLQRVSVATIKYGMLNHDNGKDIVFRLSEWAARRGNSGPFIMYCYARIQSIRRKLGLQQLGDPTKELSAENRLAVPAADQTDLSTLDSPACRALLLQLHAFWPTLEGAMEKMSGSSICDYLYLLGQQLNRFYETHHITSEQDKSKQNAFIWLITAVAETIKVGLLSLGIQVANRM